MLTPEDRTLIDKRRKVLRHLGLATWLLPLVWLATCAVTWMRYPLLCNPWQVHAALRRGELERPTVEALCAMAPILVLLLEFVVITCIVMGLLVLRREKRLVERLAECAGKERGESRGT